MPSLFLTDICVLHLGLTLDEVHSINQLGKQVYKIFLMSPDHRKRFLSRLLIKKRMNL
jgi:hypothetical protein